MISGSDEGRTFYFVILYHGERWKDKKYVFEKPRRRPNSFFSKKLLLGQTIYSDYKETNPFTKDRTLMD